ncbi:MAG: TIM barrel protein [Imperialibacter sp.]|uniref:hydroxypyruvate isomerase family protein n=1 Tax=Imperialibacter sp. TaxID=2038411 RepID=UPI0032F01CB4
MNISRKEALKKMAVSSLGVAMAPSIISQAAPSTGKATRKGNINHSVCQWCYGKKTIEELCEAAVDIGIKSVELLGEKDWPTLKKYNLHCAMAYGSNIGLNKGFNDPSLHAELLKQFTASIPKAADAGFTNVITFSGNRNGMDDMVGLENCAKGLEPVMKVAEKYGVTISMELLNSKRNHPDYMCDLTPWGVKLVDKLGSPNFKLLYDIYHMQIMEGDVIATIKEFHPYISHYHTGGVPGRNEIDETQELYYPAIMKAIIETGFKGYVAQEFIPKREDMFASLRQSIDICDV